ncbi:MAG TPA: M20/M25/M40 family metallo-hydrolase, partial [Candidatus Ozemobacteraceae bacterium]|nr:M20/M25/M40 family metallo-hydrolase [Candidatus Ozemobacteraceae bacterium]
MNGTSSSSVRSEVAAAVREEAARLFPECLKLLGDSIAIESYTGHERAQADLLLSYFDERGIPACRLPRGGILALLAPAGHSPDMRGIGDGARLDAIKRAVSAVKSAGLPILAYDAHMDVVEAGDAAAWSVPPFGLTRRDGRLYGRGTCDMKGALTAMAVSLALGKRLSSEFPLEQAVIGCFVTEEEGAEGLALAEIIRDLHVRPDRVLLGEPSQLEIARGQRGKLQFVMRARGRRAHTSVPEVGDNAAYKLAQAAIEVGALDREEFTRVGPDPERVLGRSTLVVTTFRTEPFTTSSVPEGAVADVTVRLAAGENFESIVSRLKQRPGWPDIEIERIVYRGPSYTGKIADWPSM